MNEKAKEYWVFKEKGAEVFKGKRIQRVKESLNGQERIGIKNSKG